MTAFQWSAQTNVGEKRTGTISANSKEEAARKLREKGLYPDYIGNSEVAAAANDAQPASPAESIGLPIRKIGIAVACVGFIVAVLIFLAYGITVRDSIVNLDKLGEKIMLMMFALSVFVASVVVACTAKR